MASTQSEVFILPTLCISTLYLLSNTPELLRSAGDSRSGLMATRAQSA